MGSRFMKTPTEEAISEIASLVEIGKRWRSNASLEEWFPFTAAELEKLKEEKAELLSTINLMLATLQLVYARKPVGLSAIGSPESQHALAESFSASPETAAELARLKEDKRNLISALQAAVEQLEECHAQTHGYTADNTVETLRQIRPVLAGCQFKPKTP